MKISCLSFVILLCLSCKRTYNESGTGVDAGASFINPLWSKGADPWIYQENGTYYFTYTDGAKIVLYKTKKINELYAVANYPDSSNYVSWRPPSGAAYSSNVWAPELHKINGKWYVYFAADNGTNANHRMFVIENDNEDPMTNNWVFKGKVADPSDCWAIDGTILETNQKLYMIWSGWPTNSSSSIQNLYIAQLSDPLTVSGNRSLISAPTFDWEKKGNPINEGPAILKNKDGNVFLTYSGSGYWVDDYCLGMLALKKDGDPMNQQDWVKSDTAVFTRNDAGGVFGPGHNGFFTSPDGKENWIVYHARNRAGAGDNNGRNVRIQPFTWNSNGMPVFGQAVSIKQRLNVPSGQQ